MESGTSGKRVIATWFYEQDSDEGGQYAQVRGDSSAEGFRDTYRRCLALYFLTARRVEPTARLVLVLNRVWRNKATPVAAEVGMLLERLGVETVVRDYSFRPPQGWPDRWYNQFFVYDALSVLADLTANGDLVILGDSDMVWSGSARTEDIWRTIEEQQCVTMVVDYEADRNVNGLSRHQLTDLATRIDGHERKEPVRYVGGEFIALSHDALTRCLNRVRTLWLDVGHDFDRGRATFTEEAHMLSFLLDTLDLPAGNGNRFVKRLWTQPLKPRNVDPADVALPLWHLPAEKRYGLHRLYESWRSDDFAGPAGYSQRTFLATLTRELGVPRNSAKKFARDVSAASYSRAHEAARRAWSAAARPAPGRRGSTR